MKNRIIITCEHANNKIPKKYQYLFKSALAKKELSTHLGLDLGARDAAIFFAAYFKCPLFMGDYSRLLIELNRTITHKGLFSRYSDCLSNEVKENIIHEYYYPYINNIEKLIHKFVKSGHRVIHLSIHSFTPVLHDVERQTDIGLLYDPKRKGEKELCSLIKSHYKEDSNVYKMRFNYPYKGSSDGFTTYLREVINNKNYIGIEVEINQKLTKKQKLPRDLIKGICRAIEKSLKN